MTVNKSQGQTFDHVGIYLDEPVFSHGQLYAALSRHCFDESLLKDFSCERWSQCQTCKANTTFCITCSPDRFGPTCSKISQGRTRRKRQDDPDLLNHPNYPRQSGSCPFLERPESGSIRCSQTGNVRYCTSRCLPGFYFEGEEHAHEITLRCRRGIWTPRSSFPPCRSGGHCEVEVTGAGFYNCTIDMDGTHCDITCDGWYRGRFHCYPGGPWDPPLPYCTVPKEPTPCHCQNGGICDVNGKCMCPEGMTGTYCENLERQKATCPDPGIPRDGSRLNPDGSDASYSRVFEEGESVIFTCNEENSALQGKSFITCLADGTWSAPLPRCITSRVGGPTAFCPDPGYIQFGSRINADGSNSRPSSRYRNGQSVVYYCLEGYELVGNSILTCLPSGRWSSNKPFCRRINSIDNRPTEGRDPPPEISCRHPGVDINGMIEDHPLLDPRIRGQTFPQGTQLTFDCNKGFEPEGAVVLTCMSPGEWSSAPPTCKRSVTTTTERPTSQGTCRHPGVDVNGRIEGDSPADLQRRRFPVGTELKFSCNAGFEPEGATNIVCRSNGQWTSLPPTCRNTATVGPPAELTQLCPLPEVNPNVEVEEFFALDPRKLQGFEPGDKLTFNCKEGHDLEGPSVIECLGNGRWSSPPPTCNPESRNSNTPSVGGLQLCPTPEVDRNGEVVEWLLDPRKLAQSFEPGTELTFRCKEGYILQGWDTIRCSNNGQWSNPSPKCNVKQLPSE
ncbi:CUB and sushi domain-containing protein 3 [Araneus ventricosus]|uniref:CUB and sushi domain-containing protein 3 n=1 Tax=Araneus ventricosus TaxID=182803 RepID=A0A4Y2JGR7_ARAVE|nr:CUB and sushi domain-containing protein 3 [Araneus ventricosus]